MAVIEQDVMRVDQPETEPAVLTLTEDAAGRLLQMMNEKELEGYALRVFVQGGGCSGLQYGMTFDDELREGDADFAYHGLRVFVDSISARYLQGATVKYVDTLVGGGFQIDNPNSASGCGCGKSFRSNEDGSEEADESAAADAAGGCGSCGQA